MSLEIEVKYLDVDHAALRKRLASLDAQSVGRWFESNTVFDDARRSLKASGTLLRLREKAGRYILALKRAAPAAASAGVKASEEHQTDVVDPRPMREILAGLGLVPALRYEKIREKWTVLGCEVCLDTLPFGTFVEIEGAEQDIAACATALGLPKAKASCATYHELNRLDRLARGLTPDESFVFEEADKARLLARRATDSNDPAPLDSRPRSA